MNPFEAGQRKVIPAVLVYCEDSNGQNILMLHRNAGRPGDYHDGKWNGLGGKCELDESPLEAARREVREEAGLDLAESAFQPLGTLQFPNFKAHKSEDWLVFVLLARVPAAAKPWDKGPEGKLVWVPRNDLLALNLWEGDKHFIPWVIQRKPFLGTIWYEGPHVARHWIAPLVN